MKRLLKKTDWKARPADAIICSDLHLREDTPVCRTDDYQLAQWGKLDAISDLQKEHGCPVICAGDLYDHWKPSPWLLRETILHLPDQFYTIYGQHDLPQHNLSLVQKCGIKVLEAAGKLTVLEGTHWGQTPNKSNLNELFKGRKVLVWHVMNYKSKKPWPGCTDPMAASLLRKYKDYDLIITGDNHKTFIEEYDERLLVNPGSMMRMDADQVDHKPRVFLWYAEENKVVGYFLPCKPDVISREHLEKVEERDARIGAFISKLDGDWEIGMSFEKNLETFQKSKNIDNRIMEIVYKAIE